MQVIDARDLTTKKKTVASTHNLPIIIECCVRSYSSSSALQLQFHLMGTWHLAG